VSFFKTAAHADPVLGDLVRRHGYWRGQIALGLDGDVPLALSGGRTAPDQSSMTLARELASRYPVLRPAIERALFEHYEPYADAVESGEIEALPEIPKLSRPDQVWTHVSPVHVLIEPLGRVDTVEIAYQTKWDEEHTLGARFQGWALVELNGSVLPA
jgi:hypothetical protein